MRLINYHSLMLSLYGYPLAFAQVANGAFDLQPFHIDLSHDFSKMIEQVKDTELPADYEFPGISPSFGLDPSLLKSWKDEWTTSFDWEKEQAAMNEYV